MSEGKVLSAFLVALTIAAFIIVFSKVDTKPGFESCSLEGGTYSDTDNGYSCVLEK